MSGPPKKPTAWRRAEGNRGKRAWNRAEPTPPEGVPDCPEHLSEEARAKGAEELIAAIRRYAR